MSDDQRLQMQTPQQRRHNCCRLCLAPDNECISILNSYAADKEPLASKIHSCVSIKISSSDNLSLRICHACISYLNSWQSFKNRCLSAQNKQRSWLDGASQKSITPLPENTTDNNNFEDQKQSQSQHQQQQQDEQSLASSILEGISTLKKRKSLTVYVSPKRQQQLSLKQATSKAKQPPLPPSSSSSSSLKQKHQLPTEFTTTATATAAATATALSKPLLTKRRYTKHKHSQRQSAQTCVVPQTHLQAVTATASASATAISTSPCSSSSASKYKPITSKRDKKLHNVQRHQLQLQQQQQLQLQLQQQQQLPFAIPTVLPSPTPAAATATVTCSSTSSNVTATAASCSSTSTNTLTTCGSNVVASPSTITSTVCSVGTGIDDCLAGTSASATAAGVAACSSAVQQLRLFRRYSYNPLPAVQIKNEPLEMDDDFNSTKHNDESDEMVDPTMFLERTADEGDEALMDSTANYDYENIMPPGDMKPLPAGTVIRMSTKEASCRACNLKFSTRANARRHEKNLHPHLFDTLEENDTSINKQTAALNASLELQRAVAAAVAADACKLTSGGGVISPQKYRHEVVTAFNNSCEMGYDYDNPEKYQHLLTDEKIVFLQQNDEFLRQYQAMTCRCCNRFYSTYKNFMAHMRKKYLTLPRNCCFNCLKLNDSKALFISHLKKRNCINLHKVLHTLMAKNPNFAAAVSGTVAAAPEKLRAKELLVNKMYECKLCPKTFRLKLEFRTHVYEEHADVQRKDVGNTQCSFCAVAIEDPAERKRHYNNMDCIVTLRCVTCDTKYDTQHKFMEHVQEKHMANYNESQALQHFGSGGGAGGSADNSPDKKPNLAGISCGASSADESRSSSFNVSLINTSQPRAQYFSRMPQACPICGQQYNNYNNVLRHMESKHPDQLPQTYKCVKCGQGYPRLSNLREHMVGAHGADKLRHTGFEYIVNADAVKAATGGTGGDNSSSPYSGRYDYVMKDLLSITNGGPLDDDEPENPSKKMCMDSSFSNNNNSINNNGTSAANISQSSRECPVCNAVFANNIGLSNHMRSHQSANNNSSLNAKTLSGHSLSSTPLSGQQFLIKKSMDHASDRRFRRMRCRICQRRFSSKKSYRYHMFNDHQIRNVQFIKCKLCDAEFAYEKGLKVHMFKIHNTLLKDDMIIKQYECEICSIVYRTDVELQHHLANVHNKQGGGDASRANDDEYNAEQTTALDGAGKDASATDVSGISTPVSGLGGTEGTSLGPLYWYQCKYCPSNFNTNKKLAIHINSHDEFDSNDYSCKDCGNVYSGRKSLWVHRYKKHPQIPEPSECLMCKKVFFDVQMLEHHTPTCNRKPITSASNDGSCAAAPTVYKHKTGDDDDDEDEEQSRDADDSMAASRKNSTSNLKIKLPEVACTICRARFTDQDLFAKHIQMHEMELYTDNPLAAMFDTGPADPNQFYMDRINDNGEYACDLCSKTFTQMTALKVHRKWHFRGDNKQSDADPPTSIQNNNNSSSNNNNISNNQHKQATSLQQQQQQQQHSKTSTISHQHLLGLQAVGLMPRQPQQQAYSNSVPSPHQVIKSQKRKRELQCQYCPSTFISNNNLRRHLFELHKNEIGNLPEPPRIKCDVDRNCRKCNVKFETKAEWIEHKVAEARVMKPFGPFQWGCELCGAYVSRKEKLINHLHNHMKDNVIMPVEHDAAGHQIQTNSMHDDQPQYTEFKRIKLPTLQEKPRNLQIEDEEESRDSASAKYPYEDEGDENDDNENENEQEDNGIAVNQQNNHQYEDEDEDEEEDIIEEEFDDLAVGAQQTVGGEEDDEVDEDDDDEDEEDDDEDDVDDDDDGDDEEPDTNEDSNEVPQFKPPPITHKPLPTNRSSNDSEMEEDDDEDSDEFDDDDASSTENRKPTVVAKAMAIKTFSCDLCQLYFDSQLELQKHVKMHFLNGPGSVTLTELKNSKSSSSSHKSRSSSSSDVLAMSSS